ncbi:alpha-E domain-containing protein, partial [Leptospira santarosai]|nr:alpha-E domain-containing protein [Leptospira santarosai]
DGKHWQIMFEACSTKDELDKLQNNVNAQDEDYIRYLAFHTDNLNSIYSCVRVARENARQSRDHLPNELFEVWNDLYLFTIQA